MDKNSKIDLSIIVPTFNEEAGIGKTIIEIFKDVKKASIRKLINSLEVIVVDDGSFDDTARELEKVKKNYKIKIIRHKFNQGLGAAIITGIKHSTKEFATYLPADGQVFLREISNGLEKATAADLVLTYRGRREDYNPYRHLLSNTLMVSMKIFFGLNFKDYNWVHIYKTKLFEKIRTKSKGVFYLAEVVVRAKDKGLNILEAQAKYHPRSTGYSKNAKPLIVIRTLIDLFKLWIELRFKSVVVKG
ncbi:glycosyltransferase family 2 protein [Patescibacteria group bacterium]|nr:glycosyltransferase family 2 protein [Patescibacteria group bacterium]